MGSFSVNEQLWSADTKPWKEQFEKVEFMILYMQQQQYNNIKLYNRYLFFTSHRTDVPNKHSS